MRFNSFKRYLQNERGTAIVILAGAMTLLMACTALVADIGVNFVTQSRLAVAADAAALAGATKFKDGAAQVQETALAIAAQNGIKAEDVIVNVAGSGKEVTVTATAPVQLFFARSFSKQEGDMAQSARVIAGRPTAMTNIVPLGINENANFEFNETYKLFAKNANTDELELGSGNSGALAFREGAEGANEFEYYLRKGYHEVISLGDILYTESGVKYSALKSGFAARLSAAQADSSHTCGFATCPSSCPRIIYIPVYRSLWENGKVTRVEVVDFAAFWLEAKQLGSGEWKIDKEITGRFIRRSKGGFTTEEGESPWGLSSGKLVE